MCEEWLLYLYSFTFCITDIVMTNLLNCNDLPPLPADILLLVLSLLSAENISHQARTCV